MNPQGTPTGNDDFLSREVEESQTEASIKAETLRALEQAKQIRDNFSDNTEIQREYEEVRLSTIGALRNLRINTSENLDEVRRSLTGEVDFTTLSDGDISNEEISHINQRAEDISEQERYALQDEMFRIAGAHGVDFIYGPLINEICISNIPSQMLYDFKEELEEDGKFSLSSLERMRDVMLTDYNIDNALQTSMNQRVEDAYSEDSHIDDIQSIIQEYMDTRDYDIMRNSEAALIAALDAYFIENPQFVGDFLFEDARIIFGGMCQGFRTIFIETLKERYYESREIAFETSVINYYTNNNILPENLDGFDTLVATLRNGNCNVDYIATIQSFNDSHGLDIGFTSEDARNIIGSTIELRKSENEIALLSLRDEISEITGRTPEDIQEILDSGDPAVIGEFLDEYRANPRIGGIEAEVFERLDIAREIVGQEENFDEVVTSAEEIYVMTDAERAEYRRLLMSFTGASINIDISRDVHRNYILEKPKERLVLLNSAEDLAQLLPEANEILRNSGSRERIEIDDINTDYLTHPEVLRFFINQDSYRTQIVGNLPLSLFQDIELSNIIFQSSRFLWKSLFQNIYSANDTLGAIDIIRTLISDNSNIAEEHREYLEKSVPTEIYSDVFGVESTEQYDTIRDIPTFLRNINLIINPPQEASPLEIPSPLVNGGFQEFQSPEMMPIGFDENAVIEQIMVFIRVHGLTSEVLEGIGRLIDENMGLNLVAQILPMLNASNSEHIEFAQSTLQIRTINTENGEIRETSRAGNYIHLNVAMKSHPSIIQEMGSYGIIEFKPNVIQYIRSEKLFAQYLIGYLSNEANDIQDLRYHQNIELLRRNMGESNQEELTEEEVAVLNTFYQRTIEIEREVEEAIDSVDVRLESINESQRLQIINILETAGLNRPIIDDILPENIQNLEQIDLFLHRAGEELDKVIEGDTETRNRRIREIISQIISINRVAAESRAETRRGEAGVLSPRAYRYLQENGLLEPHSTEENPQINYHGATQNYLETYRAQHPSEEALDNPEQIRAYLVSLGLSQEEIEEQLPILRAFIQAEIARRAEQDYNSSDPDTPWDRGLENPPGLYGGTEQRILEEIASGEYQYIGTGGESTTTESSGLQNSQPSIESNETQNFSHERLSISGENIYYTGPSGEQIPLSAEEAQMIENNPDAEENLVNAYNYFDNIGIPSVWKYRVDLVNAMNVMGGDMTIDLNDDSLSSDELLKVAKYIYQITHGRQSNESQVRDLGYYERELEIYANGGSEIVEKRAHDGLQRDKFEHDLWEAGVLSTNINGFDTEKLRQIAKSPEGLSQANN